MTRQQQRDFLMVLTDDVLNEIDDKLRNGTIPENWEGPELRAYVALKFTEQQMSHILTGVRLQQYGNDILTLNL
jgi:hypothetical protein